MTAGIAGPLRVAIIGASGIGRHHAKWWAIEGAEICAFAGTSPISIERARQGLLELFPFSGNAYDSVTRMIEAERPAIVDICSPPRLHAEHCRMALEAGCHVLCEKPFVFDPAQSSESLLAEASAILELAASRNLRLGVCTQYAAGAPGLARHFMNRFPGASITTFEGHLEAPNKGRPPEPERTWVDLAPHLLSVLIQLMPDGVPDFSGLEMCFHEYEAWAAFTLRRTNGPDVRCRLRTRNATEPPLNLRRFTLNGYSFTIEGENDQEGVYAARIETPDGHYHEPDMMRLLIREMLQGREAASGMAALHNLAWMLKILNRACTQAPGEGKGFPVE